MAARDIVNDFVSLMANLTAAKEVVSQVTGTASSVFELAAAVTQQSNESLRVLKDEADFTDSAEFSKLQAAIQTVQASAKSVKLKCVELEDNFNSLSVYNSNSLSQQHFGREDVRENLQLLQLISNCALTCDQSHHQLKYCLQHIIKVDSVTNLKPNSLTAQDSGSSTEGKRGMMSIIKSAFNEAAETGAAEKTLGLNDKPGNKCKQGSQGLLGLTSKIFHEAAAARSTAAAGSATVSTEVQPNRCEGNVNKLEPEFDKLKEKLLNFMPQVDILGDNLRELLLIAQKIIIKMEIAMNEYKEHDKVLQESEEKARVNSELHKQLEELQRKKELFASQQKRQEFETQEKEKKSQEDELDRQIKELKEKLQELEKISSA